MPFLDLYKSYTPWGDVVFYPILVSIAAGGNVTSFNAPPLTTVAKTGTGQYTITFGDAPYYQCVGVLTSFDQSGTLDTNAEVMGRPVTNATGTTSILTTIASGAAANWTNAGTISALVAFRKSPVP